MRKALTRPRVAIARSCGIASKIGATGVKTLGIVARTYRIVEKMCVTIVRTFVIGVKIDVMHSTMVADAIASRISAIVVRTSVITARIFVTGEKMFATG